MNNEIINENQNKEPVIVPASSVDGYHNERSSIEVFDEIHAMMAKVLLWNSIGFVEWQNKDELTSSSDFIKLCLSFIEKNGMKFCDNLYFANSEMKEIERAYDRVEGKMQSYYSSMDKPNLMVENKTTLAIISLFNEIPLNECENIDGCPF